MVLKTKLDKDRKNLNALSNVYCRTARPDGGTFDINKFDISIQ